ncbi:hypothetical protein [Agrococcus sp. HG114]|uniref:hypothetical protein n=1 Tax=Agrococcus sp. HG114 TaxID=2969757 RepID=UPI00215A1C07|nr:hypothetical protein [Agrococcus sp. HG114]MCR8669625.1 hypothetical protein [Agrococcus sp. HG114]
MRVIMCVAAAVLTALASAADDDPPEVGFFGGSTLEVAGDRLVPGTSPGTKRLTSEDWAAAWQAYLAARFEDCVDAATPGLARCDVVVVDRRPGATAPAPAIDPITMSDLAAFRPIVGQLVVEPDGWGVVDTPTNFYATAESHTMDGELFDVPIQVRWTPTSYVFDYGDGTSETSSASGTAWQGPEESWTETATSHTYASRDDVTASVTVVFTAEVNAGGGWFAVSGTLAVQAPSVGVKVFEVGTVLTDGDCMANPSAAGCGG